MEILGLHYAIWIVVILYFAGMLLLGWRSRREAKGREGFLMGKRQFGVPMMVMHAFGAGTHPGDVTTVMSKTVQAGASGIWMSWMWMFGTPFYWIIAPIVRRMRCLTLADYFEERFGRAASVLYVCIATVGMIFCTSSVLLSTTRTVQGMMGKAEVLKKKAAPAAGAAAPAPAPPEAKPEERPAWAAKPITEAESEAWFFGILIVTTLVFVVYSHWGGIVAAIRTDFIQGLMIIVLSFLAIPAALQFVGGWSGTLETLRSRNPDYLSLANPVTFSLLTIIVLCINAPFSMMAQPHLMTVCGAGRTEWEGRVGFTYGNVLKRICTMGWCILALCWLAYLFTQQRSVHPDAAFGDSVRALLPAVLQGVMLACVMAAGMSTGSALQVTVGALFSQNFYRHYIRPNADDDHCVKVTKIAGLAIIAAATGIAILMRHSVITTILDYFNMMMLVGVAVVMGILWRRMNSVGVFTSAIVAVAIFVTARYAVVWKATGLRDAGVVTMAEVSRDQAKALKVKGDCVVEQKDEAGDTRRHLLVEWGPNGGTLRALWKREILEWSGGEPGRLLLVCSRFSVTALPLLAGILGGILGSLLSKPPRREAIERFFTKIYVPIGQEAKLGLPLDQAVPPSQRWLTAGGLFIVKPDRQSWVGFLLVLAICLALVGLMAVLIGM